MTEKPSATLVAHGSSPILRQCLIHFIAAHIVRVAADFNVESRVGEQNTVLGHLLNRFIDRLIRCYR
jgi:hypothetical protein